jgi:outer membrane protein OmpA-like peptidoglycan-associated protein
MNRYLSAALLALCCLAVTANAADCDTDASCPMPAQPGKSVQTGQTATRHDNRTAPSAEYRRADEALVLATPQATPVIRARPVIENRPDATPGTLPQFPSGSEVLQAGEGDALAALAARLTGKTNVRIRITGHADLQRLTTVARQRYRDNQGLSEARAREVMNWLKAQSGMTSVPMTVVGRGATEPLVSCDPRQAYAGNGADMLEYKACLAPNRRVNIEVWYDQQIATTTEMVVTAPTVIVPPPCSAQSGGDAGLPFRVSVDGVPLASGDVANSADTTRCTDIALEEAEVQVRFDGLAVTPVLNLTAQTDGAAGGTTVHFTPYNNYRSFISRAEVRVFATDDSTQKLPLAVIPLDPHADAATDWQAPADRDAVQYLLRVYASSGQFDETVPRILQLQVNARSPADHDTASRETLIGYGENHRGLANIRVSGGAVTVNGEHLQAGSLATVFGRAVPVDANGRFAARQILPAGTHPVDVATAAPGGQRAEFRRHIDIPYDDWFYVALADLSFGQNHVTGPAKLVTGDDGKRLDGQIFADGRLAYYLKGKIKGATLLTTSADTREQPVEHLFSNFASKDPRYLLRRIDPDAYYPVYGDDSTLVDDAPTQGKFFVKLERGESQLLWGSFATRLTGTDLVNYGRALYGAQLRYVAPAASRYGEKRGAAELFAADPGTLAAVEEFRGTGGSLYYLRNQDILTGSERLRIEIRDRDSGIVLSTTTLVAGQDYEINSIQGRVVLREPLEAIAAGNTLLLTGALSGQAVYLVAGYEYTPGLTASNSLALGGRASRWFGDHLNLGVTGYRQDSIGTEQRLLGGDLTWRYRPGTYLKLTTWWI